MSSDRRPEECSATGNTRGGGGITVIHQVPEQEKKTIQFTIPPGVSGGQVIKVNIPGGTKLLDVRVPLNAVAGCVVEIPY